MFNTQDIADNLKKNNGYIPGIRPGKPTYDFLDKVLHRVTFFGACFLLTPVLMLLGFFGAGLRRVRAAQLMSGGIPATGTVLSVEGTGLLINGNPRLRMTFHIVPDDGITAPFEGTKTTTVPITSTPRVGDSYPVFIDPQDHSKWMVAVAGPAMSEGRLRSVIDIARHGAGPAMPPAS